MIVDSTRSKRRATAPHESNDHKIDVGDFFGTTSELGAQVWHFDGSKAVRVGISNPDHRSMTLINGSESLREAMQRLPMFAEKTFILHKMELPPGAYYPRMSRPHDQYPLESPGMLPRYQESSDLIASTLNQVRYLVGMLDTIFQTIHPTQENMGCYGNSIRNLLILACTECEAQWRGVLQANGVTIKKPNTNQYVKLAHAMRLSEYAVKLRHCPWLEAVSPFEDWNTDDPTNTIPWYNDYHSTKHNREDAFMKATLGSAIQAVSAVWIMVISQFGIQSEREFIDLSQYFYLERVPLWRFSEVYTHGYDGFEGQAGARHYPF